MCLQFTRFAGTAAHRGKTRILNFFLHTSFELFLFVFIFSSPLSRIDCFRFLSPLNFNNCQRRFDRWILSAVDTWHTSEHWKQHEPCAKINSLLCCDAIAQNDFFIRLYAALVSHIMTRPSDAREKTFNLKCHQSMKARLWNNIKTRTALCSINFLAHKLFVHPLFCILCLSTFDVISCCA